MSQRYLEHLQIAALFHDIGKADYRNRATPFKTIHNQGEASVQYLEANGFRGHHIVKDLIRNHHKPVQGEQVLKLADQVSSTHRLEGGNTNQFMPYFPLISEKISGCLKLMFNRYLWCGVGAAYKRILRNPWLDVIPADMNCSLESQSLRQHLIETHDLAVFFWNNPSAAMKAMQKLHGSHATELDGSQIYTELKPFGLEERMIAPLNRKLLWKFIEKEENYET